MQHELHPSSSFQESLHGRRLTVFNGKAINISALARILDVDQGNLSKFLSGQRISTVPYARRVAQALHISMDELLNAIDARLLEKSIQ